MVFFYQGADMKLKDKIAIVTGASRGIGKAIAIGLANQGARVVVAARSEVVKNANLPGTISDTVAQIERAGGKALAIRCDVTDEQSVQSMADKTLEVFGGIDILVNNAGVAFYYPVVETPLSRWDIVLKVNLYGAFLCSKAVLPTMIKQQRGSIVNISSLAADERDEGTVPTGVAYAVAKAGVDRFTWGLATEVGRYNIAVNGLKPKQPVDTEGMRFWLTDEEKAEAWVSPEKIVTCALFLAAQDAKGVTGTVATDEELCGWHGL
jgi:NAD(P)-dependent dehydrogenase (short-subunit alcohol dehydrogenase family)